ncbi:ribosomal L28 family-domain-containing protein, partial [Catenaria anguillulae PL171]
MPLTSTLRTALIRGTSRPSRADSGLLATKRILSGHKVSHSEHKTKRTWKPNVVDQSLYSRVLNQHLRIKVSTNALRTMDKKGGLDAYLLTTPDDKIDSALGVALKRKVEAVLMDKTKD